MHPASSACTASDATRVLIHVCPVVQFPLNVQPSRTQHADLLRQEYNDDENTMSCSLSELHDALHVLLSGS